MSLRNRGHFEVYFLYTHYLLYIRFVFRKDNLYVKDIQEDRIIVAGDHLTNVNCFYQIWADRLGETLITEYEGETPSDYPGDNSAYSVAGHDYDVRS